MKLFTFVGMLALVILMVMVGPWCMIWAINTLVAAGGVTGFYIHFTFETWLAALFLGGVSIIPRTRRG